MAASGQLFSPFAQTCAWLGSLLCNNDLPEAHRKAVSQGFRKLAAACGKMQRGLTYEPEGLCRLSMAMTLWMQGCQESDNKVDGEKALANIARCFLAHAADKAITWC